jgi:nicotinate dehydrogenase subunit A
VTRLTGVFGVTRLTVNGAPVAVGVDPEASLLSVLRGELGLVGTRFGCGLGQCGACFVLLNGRVTASCDTPLWSAEGGTVVTVEGLAADSTPHPVQRAFLEEQAGQCGYCLSGMAISAAALLASDPSPDEEAVVAALERNLCRCGAQGRLVRAVLRAAEPSSTGTAGRAGSGTPDRTASGTPDRTASGTPDRTGTGTADRTGRGAGGEAG